MDHGTTWNTNKDSCKVTRKKIRESPNLILLIEGHSELICLRLLAKRTASYSSKWTEQTWFVRQWLRFEEELPAILSDVFSERWLWHRERPPRTNLMTNHRSCMIQCLTHRRSSNTDNVVDPISIPCGPVFPLSSVHPLPPANLRLHAGQDDQDREQGSGQAQEEALPAAVRSS